MKTLNWRLAFAGLIASLATLGLTGCAQQDEPDDTATSDVVPDNDATEDIDDADVDEPTDDATDDLPGEDMTDEAPMDDPTGDHMEENNDDATEAPTP